jgi:ketosteroid isomerase-like protein
MSEESTTPDLVERVRFMLGDAAIRRDFDAILASFAPNAIWIMPTQEFRGTDAIRRHWEEWYDSYEDFQFGPPDVADIGNGVVLATVMQGGRPGGSTSELSQELALIYEWSNGSVVRVTASAGQEDVAAARAAAERLARERE